MKENNQKSKKGVVIDKREFRVLASTKLEAEALKAASRSLAGRSYKSLFERSREEKQR